MILPFIFYKYHGEKSDIDMDEFDNCEVSTIVHIACCDRVHDRRRSDEGDEFKTCAGTAYSATYLKPDIDIVLEEHVFGGPSGEKRAIAFVKRWWAENDPLQTSQEYLG